MIDAQTTLNLQLRYALPENFGGVRVGINNLTDEEPPVDPTEANWPWFRQEFHDAFGRNYYVEYNFNFWSRAGCALASGLMMGADRAVFAGDGKKNLRSGNGPQVFLWASDCGGRHKLQP